MNSCLKMVSVLEDGRKEGDEEFQNVNASLGRGLCYRNSLNVYIYRFSIRKHQDNCKAS